MNRTKLWATVVLAGTFALGTLAGFAGGYAHSQRECARLLDPRGEGPPARMLEAFARELDLRSDQRQAIRAIFERRRQGMEQARLRMFEQCGKTLLDHQAEAEAEIRALLDPEQQARFDELRAHRQRWRPRWGYGPQGHGGPGGGLGPRSLGGSPPGWAPAPSLTGSR